MRVRRRNGLAGFACVAACVLAVGSRAQFAGIGAPRAPVRRDQPVYYQADAAEYDRGGGVVTLSGHVEIWQDDRVLRADRVTYDRNTAVAAATGHVVVVEPDGQVLFSDYAELTGDLKNGVLRNVAAQMAENGKLVANGARRVNARINELSRVVYSTCDLCKEHPERAPLWQLRARAAVQDLDNKRIEYRDAVLDIYGVPVFWMPYLTHPDPSAKRASGLLIPSAGSSSHLGAFVEAPYYWAIDPQQDAIITPTVATQTGPAVRTLYRRRFNSGEVTVNASLAYDNHTTQAAIFSTGQFAIDDEWRWGFDINRASSSNYARDFQLRNSDTLLSSQVYLEGFGQGAYSRLDTRFYQGLTSDVVSARLPYVLPRYQYHFSGEPDALGGRLSVEAGGFNVLRDVGANTERLDTRVNWERPYTGALGDLWSLVLHGDAAAYSTRQLDQQPSWGPRNTASTAQALPTAALNLRWPFIRDSQRWGSQVIEPIAQLVGAPYASSYGRATGAGRAAFLRSTVPNEDSLGVEFTDATLFALNRFSGVDRLEGGPRAALALHGAWYLPQGGLLDAQIGQAYRLHRADAFPTGSGLDNTVSDVVGHVTVSPTSYFDITTRARFNPHSWRASFVDGLASAGPSWLRVTGGYLYSLTNVFRYYDSPPTGTFLTGAPRHEVTAGLNTSYGHYRLGVFGRRDIALGRNVFAAASASYEDECFAFSGVLSRRYTSLGGDNGATTVLFQVTLKTVGTYGFHAF